MEVITNALAHRDYLIQGSEVHVDMFDDRMEIYSPGAMPEGRLIQNMDLDNIPSIRRNPVIADIFTQLGYMERKGSGMGKIIFRSGHCHISQNECSLSFSRIGHNSV